MKRYKKIVPVLVASMTLSLFQPVSMNWAHAAKSSSQYELDDSMEDKVPTTSLSAETTKPMDTDSGNGKSTAIVHSSTNDLSEETAEENDIEVTASADPEDINVLQQIKYEVEGDHIVVTGYVGNPVSLTIPAKITLDGTEYPVKTIRYEAFKGCTSS